jgi:flagellar basal body rod protein FlgG
MVTGYGETALVRGLTFLAQKQAAIANNLANVDTTSFKRRAAVASSTGERFQSLLDQQLSAIDYVERNDMQRGILRETGNRLDVAIDGSQWLRVQDQAGRQRARAGRSRATTTSENQHAPPAPHRDRRVRRSGKPGPGRRRAARQAISPVRASSLRGR